MKRFRSVFEVSASCGRHISNGLSSRKKRGKIVAISKPVWENDQVSDGGCGPGGDGSPLMPPLLRGHSPSRYLRQVVGRVSPSLSILTGVFN